MFQGITLLDSIALLVFLVGWSGYTYVADGFSQKGRNLMTVMYEYRQQWMRQSLTREVRVGDAALLSTLIRSVSLFASTAIFIIGGVVAIFGGLEEVQDLTKDLSYIAKTSQVMWEIKLLTLGLVFIYAFFKFAWSLRQFNYMIIVMGAFPQPDKSETPEAQALAERAARVNALAVQTFNRGMRAYYFGMAVLAWFIHSWVFIGATLLVCLVIYRREFKSKTLQMLDPLSDYTTVSKF